MKKCCYHGLTILGFLHIGPVPRHNESESSYLIRWSLFALRWGILFFLLIFAASYFLPQRMVNENMLLMGIFFFALPLLLGMCVLGGLYTLALSLRPSSKKKVFSRKGSDQLINQKAGRMPPTGRNCGIE